MCCIYKGVKNIKKERLMIMKKYTLKKLICLIMANVFLLLIAIVPANAAMQDEIAPCYNNVITANSTATISSSGVITVTNTYTGSQSVTTKAVITTYIEKRTLGIFWSRVDIGQTDDEWVDTIYNYKYSGSHSAQLPSTGTYRVTVEYVIYGSGGAADTITKEIEKIY